MSGIEEPDLKAGHELGIRGIIKDFSLKKLLISFPFISSLILASVWCCLTYSEKDGNYADLEKLADFSITVFPSLLGFNLGGYALLIGFGNTTLIKSMTDRVDGDASLFQNLSAIFAFSILLQAVALILAILVRQFIEINLSFSVSAAAASYTNIGVFFVLGFLSLWALLLLPYVITNLFTFGQLHHFFLAIEKIKEERKNKIDEASQTKTDNI